MSSEVVPRSNGRATPAAPESSLPVPAPAEAPVMEPLPGPVADVVAPDTAAPPVAAQRASHVNAAKLESEKVVVAAPTSYAGSAARIWKLTGLTAQLWGRIGLGILASALILCAWVLVTAWYLTWGLLLVPYRVVRRGQRKRRREALQHRELISAITDRDRK